MSSATVPVTFFFWLWVVLLISRGEKRESYSGVVPVTPVGDRNKQCTIYYEVKMALQNALRDRDSAISFGVMTCFE